MKPTREEFHRGIERQARLKALMAELCATHVLGADGRPWTFKLDPIPVRRLGQCRYFKREVAVSLSHLLFSEWEHVEDTLRHELAHAYSWEKLQHNGHGAPWRQACVLLGAQPKATACIDEATREAFAARLNEGKP